MAYEDGNNCSDIESLLETSYQAIVDAFVDIEHLSKEAFFKKTFCAAFDMIPCAEKGSFYESDGKLFRPILARGYDLSLLRELEFTIDSLFIGFEVEDHSKVDVYEFHNEKRDDDKFSTREIEVFKALGTYEEFTSIYAPVIHQGETVGLLCFERFDGQSYSNSSKLILKLYAELISKFHTQMMEKEKERQRYEEIISAMVASIEVKDAYTEGHAQRVRELAAGLAEYMNLDARQVRAIETAAVLHDIGKIGIHSEILAKPGKLTADEFELIKEHPRFTRRILANISDFSDVVDIAYQHHEYYDGTGYPQGLKGEDILIEAAVVTVVDAFDAMTTDRSYRKAMSSEQALAIIRRGRGGQFHPLVVDRFLDWRNP